MQGVQLREINATDTGIWIVKPVGQLYEHLHIGTCIGLRSPSIGVRKILGCSNAQYGLLVDIFHLFISHKIFRYEG